MKPILKILSVLFFLYSQAEAQITINFTEEEATVTVPETVTGVIYSVTGTNVVIFSSNTTDEYIYSVSGSCSDGSLSLRGSYKLTLELNGINLTNNHGGAAIYENCGKRSAVIIKGGTVNTLSDAATNTQKAAIYFEGHPEFEGGGTLNVSGKAKHAIASKEYMELKATTGTINILEAASDGIHCGKGKVNNEHNYFKMKGGTVNIMNVGSDGIDADDYGTIHIQGGSLSINVDADAKALKADSILNISGGDISIHAKGTDSDALRANYAVNISGGDINIVLEGDGTKGIKSKCETESTVNNGGNVNISGGYINILALGDNFTDATGDVTTCTGASIDGNLNLTAGELHITTMGEEAKDLSVKGTESIADNTLFTSSSPWKVNPYSYLYDMTVYCIVKLNGTALNDYTNKSIGAFSGDQCIGIAIFDTNSFGTMRLYSNTATIDGTLSFRLHDYDTNTEFELTANQDVTFTSDTYYGLPSNPVILSSDLNYYGDANCDKQVDISDVVAVVNYVLNGSAPDNATFEPLNADVNEDGIIDISDVVGIVNMILNAEPLRPRTGSSSR
ncbi:MAG: carbohydrate-binding domain-containing protein [Bacteroidaceae bacterium]|nr:carbohydrate-binding domain-containing protein [Bacteroidaceae bacterium]